MTTTSKKTPQELVPHLNGSEMSESEHFVQFYETDEFLLDSLIGFIGTGLSEGDACIVIATKAHRERLEERLKANGQDLATAHTRGEYTSLDVVEMLSKFMVDGSPQPERFAEVFGGMIAQAAQGRRHVRIFGEMVALLWTEGNRTAAIRLEELWNDLHHSVHPFSLFCSYSMPGCAGDVYEAQFLEICKQHSHVIPDESYSTLSEPDERLRVITLLQQKANSLQAEIAERKAVEERLRISEIRYRRLFEASKDGILMVDPGTRTIIDANPSITDLLGYTHEQLLGQELWQIGLFQDREPNLEALRQLQEHHFFRYETTLQSKDGQRRYIEFVSTLYQADGHEVIQCSIRDVTDRKELEQRKDEFISMASHELKTPITSLKGFLSLLQRRLTTQGDEKALHYLSRMDTQVKKLTRLISDLLDISRMQTGQLVYREEHFAVDVLVQEIVENVQETTSTHHLRLEGQTRAEVFGDRDRIGQVLINLLNNAIKYSPQANTVLVHVAKDSHQVIVSVQDFGIGIAKEHQRKIFERFYQVTDAAEKTYPGLGIGLYISCEIVKRYGGRLWVESKKGGGATFHFTLPLY